MVKQYRFLVPFPTEAVVHSEQIDECTEISSYQEVTENGLEAFPFHILFSDETAVFSRKMKESDRIYGLGEQVRGINKRGFMYVSNCSDDCHHHENVKSLYAAHNFLLYAGKEPFGLFVDTPAKVVFDCGFTHLDELVIRVPDGNADIYLITPDSAGQAHGGQENHFRQICRIFRSLIGESYIPPKWAFGYQQSRWGYMNEQDVREVAKGYRDNGIGLDAIYMDIDYMTEYMDFTVNPERFPDLAGLCSEMGEQGIHLVPIIDAGVKIKSGYPVYEEGVAGDFFCKNETGDDFVTAVWPGQVHLPDVLNKSARQWFGNWYQVLTAQGIDGFWNDMNEPAMFYTMEGLGEYFGLMKQWEGINMGVDEVFQMRGMAEGIANNATDYKRFYHRLENFDAEIGTKLAKIDGFSFEANIADNSVGVLTVRHDKVHNLYGFNMIRAAGEALLHLFPEKRILLFSRSSYIGMHRYGGIWTGDNASRWDHLLMNIHMMPGLNMCGFLYSGADMGGFGEDTTEDLLIRWTQFSMFTPLMRNHSSIGTRNQEMYQFDNIETFRNLIGIRYALLPYIYSEFMKAVQKNDLLFAPLCFAYPEDEQAACVEDQLLFGEGLMLAPVYTQNAKGRYVYLPEAMLCIRMSSTEDWEARVLPAGHHYIKAELRELVFFLRKGHILPLGKPALCVKEITDEFELIGYEADESVYELYTDDGYTRKPEKDGKTVVFAMNKNQMPR